MTSGKKEIVALRCTVCCRFKERIQSSRNFSDKWIRDHAKTNQHYLAMKLLEKELTIAKGDGLSIYAPIARAIEKIPVAESARLRHKFDIAYLVATEKLSYLKYPNICELERKHGVDIGLSYTNERSGRIFIHYIAEARRRELVDKIDKVNFFLFCWMDLPIKVILIMKHCYWFGVT